MFCNADFFEQIDSRRRESSSYPGTTNNVFPYKREYLVHGHFFRVSNRSWVIWLPT